MDDIKIHDLAVTHDWYDLIKAGHLKNVIWSDLGFTVGDYLKIFWTGYGPVEPIFGKVTYITSEESPCTYSSIALQPRMAIISFELVEDPRVSVR